MLQKLFSGQKSSLSIISWSLYNFANTAFSAIIVTTAFPILIKRELGGSEFQIGIAMGISLFIAAISVPIIGAFADALGKRIPIIAVTTFLTVFFTATIGYGNLATALFLGALANLFYHSGFDVYSSFLADLAPASSRGRLSGLGAATGYLGGITSLILAFGVLSIFGFESIKGIQILFITIAVFLLVFSLPLLFFVKDHKKETVLGRSAFKKAYQELIFTFTHIRKIPGLGGFLSASFFYSNAMYTAIIFLSLYGTTQVGLSLKQFLATFILMSLAALVGSFVFGKISDEKNPRVALITILLLWMVAIVILMFSSNLIFFLIGSCLGGALIGGIRTCNRHMVTSIAPSHKIAEIFGFAGLTEKAAGVIGPIGFGFIVNHYGYNLGLSFLMFLFFIGLVLLWRFVPSLK